MIILQGRLTAIRCLCYNNYTLSGGVSERFKELVLKTSDALAGTVGSNPTPSASNKRGEMAE